MTAREELAAGLAEHREVYDSDCGLYCGCSCGWDNGTVEHNNGYADHVADALLASPALARVIREAKAEAWDEGRRDTRAGWLDPTHYVFNPYRDQTEEPT